ncbi:MAG: hypothetical protein ACK452_08425, partial [Bacteroidota bacterium]
MGSITSYISIKKLNKPKIIFICLVCFFCCASQSKQTYYSLYPDKFFNGIDWLKRNYDYADSVINSFELNSKKVLALGIPECSRYSTVQDYLESTSNFYLYVKLGTDYANFSIGRFQMKPSFVEKLETVIKNKSDLSEFRKLFPAPSNNTEKERKERLSRMEQDHWQIIYLCLVYKYLEYKFKSKTWKSEEEKIEFYATAYNIGFWKKESEILKWKNTCSFP